MTDRAMRQQPRSIQAHRVRDPASAGAVDPNIRSPRREPLGVRRIVASLLSALVPGFGQALNGRRRLAAGFLLPVIALAVVAGLVLLSTPPATVLARVVTPEALGLLAVGNLIVLAWRLAAIGQAFADPRSGPRVTTPAIVGLIAIVLFTIAPHVVAKSWIDAAQTSFARIFQGPTRTDAAQAAALTSRVNVLIIGIDKTQFRTETLTDSMMVASLDPVGHTVSLVSLPRDLVNVPLGNGSNFGPKLNSLMSYAERNKDQFPAGGIKALESAVGALLGIRIDYYARMDFTGFMKMVDAVGGVDIVVAHGFSDELYDGYGLGPRGFTVTAGPHHFDGPHALAYARSRQAIGESDFKRAARQQEVLLALRDKVLDGGALFWRVPQLLSAFGDFVTTDLPIDMLPSLAAVVDAMGTSGVTRTVISSPLVHSGRNQYGSVQIPDVRRIHAVAKGLFTTPGVPPTPWPTPKPSAGSRSASPRPGASAAASPAG
jgi:LCP family protein required for cell wall assembly